MRPEQSQSGEQLRPFSKVIGEWAEAERTGQKPQPVSSDIIRVFHEEKEVELRRMRRWAVTAVTFMLATVLASGAMLWYQEARRHRMVSEFEKMSGRIAEIDTMREQIVEQATTVRHELSQVNTTLAVTQKSVDRLVGENETLQQQLSAAREETNAIQDRERQARARWAYAEGERDALAQQLDELLNRLNDIATLKNESLPDVTELPSVIDLDPELRQAADETPLPASSEGYGPTIEEE